MQYLALVCLALQRNMMQNNAKQCNRIQGGAEGNCCKGTSFMHNTWTFTALQVILTIIITIIIISIIIAIIIISIMVVHVIIMVVIMVCVIIVIIVVYNVIVIVIITFR